MKFAILLLSFFWLGGFASAQTLQVTGQIMGEISPCGCSPGKEKGGIARLSTYLKANQGGLWVDLGNYSSPPTEQGELKNQLWAKAFTDNSLFALLPGPLEFSQGKRGLAKRPLPYLLTNLLSPVANVDRVKTQVDWQFFGFLSPELLSSGRHKTDLLGGVEFFLKEVGKNRSAARHRALLFRGSDQELKEIVQTGLFELVLPANQAVLEEDQKEILVLGTRQYPLPPIKGQGVLEISLDNQKTVRTLWLDKAFEADKAWVPEFKAYDQAVEKLFESFLKSQQKAPDKRVYKGSAYCVTCHQEEGAIHQGTAHAQAFGSLEKVGRDRDPDCIACHSAGFLKGGFVSKETTPGLENVGCESCHGQFRPHVEKPPSYVNPRQKVTEKTCKNCHQGSHSPDFKFETYYPKIVHTKQR